MTTCHVGAGEGRHGAGLGRGSGQLLLPAVRSMEDSCEGQLQLLSCSGVHPQPRPRLAAGHCSQGLVHGGEDRAASMT